MDKQKFWRQLFARNVKGQSKPAESKLLNQFFDDIQSEPDRVWRELKETPEQIRLRMLENVRYSIRSASSAPSTFNLRYIGGIAASLIMLAGLSYYFFASEVPLTTDTAAVSEVSAWKAYSTQAGEQKQIVLPDSSKVHLNYKSSIRIDASQFEGQERKVYLEGEAFFEVQRNEQSPFIVETTHLSTRVLGTSFNINAQSEAAIVAVASGKVEVSTHHQAQASKLTLKPNEGAAIDIHQKQLTYISQIAEETFLWREGILSFKALPLQQVITSLEDAYGMKIQCDASLLNRSVTAQYQKQPLPQVLDDLCFLLGAVYQINPNQNITITSP